MERRISVRLVKLLGCTLLGFAASCTLAYADDAPTNPDDNPRLLAKIAKAKVKQSQKDRDLQQSDNGNSSSGCGVDIGNINTPQTFGAPREVTVIITGDVINTAKNCK